MIKMGVCQHNRGNVHGGDRERRPIAQAQRFESLKQPAIDEDTVIRLLQEVFGACNGSRTAEEGKFEAHLSPEWLSVAQPAPDRA